MQHQLQPSVGTLHFILCLQKLGSALWHLQEHLVSCTAPSATPSSNISNRSKGFQSPFGDAACVRDSNAQPGRAQRGERKEK